MMKSTSGGKEFSVGIIGAGVGGLSLAQALKKRGVRARVFERDQRPDFREQGYRLTLHPSGLSWLRQCLPADKFAQVVASSTAWSGMGMLDERLRPILELKGTATPSRSIDRRTLRAILLSDLDEVVFAKAFNSYREMDGGVEVTFGDGAVETVDLLIGADGSRSSVRRQKLPAHAELFDTGYADIAGRIPWSEETAGLMEALGGHSMVIVTPVAEESLIVIPQADIRSRAAGDGYLYWGLVAKRARIESLSDGRLEGAGLLECARVLTRDYHPRLRGMIEATPASGVSLLRFSTSRKIDAWPATRVTLIGDAIHSMSPMAGAGANTALEDAGELAIRLTAFAKGRMALVEAIGDFESSMRLYGFDAVERSQKMLDRIGAGSPVSRRASRAFLRSINRLAPGLVNRVMGLNRGLSRSTFGDEAAAERTADKGGPTASRCTGA